MKQVLTGIVVLLCFSATAQDRFESSKELGLSVGTAYYLGEINRNHFGGRLHVGAGILYRNNFNKRWTLKIGLQYGKISAYDEDSDDAWQQNRNLHFENPIVEGSAQIELNFKEYQIGSKSDFWSPYLFIGLGYYSMNPKAELEGNWYELQPLGTEGQGTTEGEERYSNTGVSIPFGMGIKVNLFKGVALNLEWGMRRTYSDYLDDVSTSYVDPALLLEENGRLSMLLADQSFERTGPNGDNAGMQRGDSSANDMFSFTHITLAFRIDKRPNTCWK